MAHIHEKIDFTTSVYIVRDGKVLLLKHKVLGIWLPPGGHIELDEDPNQSAVREAKEETGYDVELVGESHSHDTSPYGARELIVPAFLNRHYYDETHTHEHVDSAYFARITGGEEVAEEGSSLRWFTKEELEANTENVVPDVRMHGLAALERLG